MILFVHNKQEDFSIFRILDQNAPSHSPHIRLRDLHAQTINHSNASQQETQCRLRIWTAGYCSNNEALHEPGNGNLSVEEINLRARNPLATEYDILAMKFRTALRGKQNDKYMDLFPSNAEDQVSCGVVVDDSTLI